MVDQPRQSNIPNGSDLRIRDEILAAAMGDAQPCDAGGFERIFQFASSFTGFDGHFPSDPILPGIVQILLVHASVADRMRQPLTLVQVKSVKFREIIRPDEAIRVTWTEQAKAGQIQCKAALTIRQTTAASLTLLFSVEPRADHAPSTLFHA